MLNVFFRVVTILSKKKMIPNYQKYHAIDGKQISMEKNIVSCSKRHADLNRKEKLINPVLKNVVLFVYGISTKYKFGQLLIIFFSMNDPNSLLYIN